MERNDKKAKIKVELNKRNKGETSNTRGNGGEDKFYVPHPICADVERKYGELLSSIENGNHEVFEVLRVLKSEGRVSMGKVNDILVHCDEEFHALDDCAYMLSAEIGFASNEQQELELESLRARVRVSKDNLAKAANHLWQNGKGLISVGALAENIADDVKKESPNSRPETEVSAVVLSADDFETEDEAKEWMKRQSGKLDLDIEVRCTNYDEIRGVNGLYNGENFGCGADLNDKQIDGKTLSSHLELVEISRGGKTYFRWQVDDASKLLANRGVRHLYTDKHGWGIDDYYPASQEGSVEDELNSDIRYMVNKVEPYNERIIRAGYYENAGESQENKES